MAVAAHRLKMLVAFFFPIATLTALFDANFRHGLEEWDRVNAPLPLIVLISAGLLCGALLTGFIARPARRSGLSEALARHQRGQRQNN